MGNLILGFKRNIINNNNNNNNNNSIRGFTRQTSTPQVNPLLQPRSITRPQVSMFTSVRRPCAQLQFGGTPGCGCGM